MSSPAEAPPRTDGPPRLWLALDVVALLTTALLAAFFGTAGYVVVGMGTLTSCTTDAAVGSGDVSCRPAELWLGAGAVGQGVVVLAALVLLVVAALRPGARPRVLWVAVGGAVASVAWVVLTSVAASMSW